MEDLQLKAQKLAKENSVLKSDNQTLSINLKELRDQHKNMAT